MDMDWKDVAAKVVSLGAPMLGSALGGPLGGMAGKVLADAFGAAAATPEAVHTAISDKAADLKIAAEAAQRAESEWMSALAEIGKQQVSEIGQTMRTEAASEDMLQRWWRPLYALELSLIECPAFALTLLHALWNGHEAGINGLANLSGLLMTYFGARFGVLGVYVSGRTREKQSALTREEQPSIVGTVLKAVVRNR
jgi:Holin of 3TMs, for gene-transfer release